MVLRCIKIFHSKRGNSHWCQNSNQRKFLEHSSLIITVSLPTLFLLTLSSLLSLSLSLTLSRPLSFSLLLSYWCQISNPFPTFYLFSFPLFILTLSLPTFSLFSHSLSLLPILSSQLFHPTLSSLSLFSLHFLSTLIPLSHPTLTPISLLTPTSSLSYPSHTPVSHTNLLELLSLSSHTLLSLPSISYHSYATKTPSLLTLLHPLSLPSPHSHTPFFFTQLSISPLFHTSLSPHSLTPISLTTLSPSFLKPLPTP